MRYTEKVMTLVERTLTASKEINTQIRELKAIYRAERITTVDFKQQLSELETIKRQLCMDAAQQLQAMRNDYQAAATKNSEIDSSMLHEDAKLLQLGVKMNAHQFETLVEKHRDNPLMAQLLQEYSNKHEGLYAGFIPTAESKIKAFDSFIGSAQNTIRDPESLQAAFFQTGKYTPQQCTESE